jgi:hypothetical protein
LAATYRRFGAIYPNDYAGATPKAQLLNAINDYAGRYIKLGGDWAFGNDRMDITPNDTIVDATGAKITCTGDIDAPLFRLKGSRTRLIGANMNHLGAADATALQQACAVWITGDGAQVSTCVAQGPFYLGFVAGETVSPTTISSDDWLIDDCETVGVQNRGFYSYLSNSGGKIRGCRTNGYRNGVRKTAYGLNVNRALPSAILSDLQVSDFRSFGHVSHGAAFSGRNISVNGVSCSDGDAASFGAIFAGIVDSLSRSIQASNIQIRGGAVGISANQVTNLALSNVDTSDTATAAMQLFGVDDGQFSNISCRRGTAVSSEGIQSLAASALGTVPARGCTDLRFSNVSSTDWGTGRVPFRVSGTGTSGIVVHGANFRRSQYGIIIDSPADRVRIESGDVRTDVGGTSVINNGTNSGVAAGVFV